jgi:hypothetical protein
MRLIVLLLANQQKKYNRVSAKNLARFPGAGRKSVFSENMMKKHSILNKGIIVTVFLSFSCVFTLVALVRRTLTQFYQLMY